MFTSQKSAKIYLTVQLNNQIKSAREEYKFRDKKHDEYLDKLKEHLMTILHDPNSNDKEFHDCYEFIENYLLDIAALATYDKSVYDIPEEDLYSFNFER